MDRNTAAPLYGFPSPTTKNRGVPVETDIAPSIHPSGHRHLNGARASFAAMGEILRKSRTARLRLHCIKSGPRRMFESADGTQLRDITMQRLLPSSHEAIR